MTEKSPITPEQAVTRCVGCKFYHPEKPHYIFGVGYNRRWCGHGSFHSLKDCAQTDKIYT